MSLSRFALATLLFALIAGSPPADDACVCAEARRANGWCGSCDTGYVAGVEIASRALHEALDAHGHRIPGTGLRCARCRENFEGDGFCDECRLGFVDGMGYFSRLTYQLARGEVVGTATLTCPACAAAAAQRRLPLDQQHGWCDACKAGMVGNTRFTDRDDFEKARREFERLLRAIEASRTCQRCGVAAFFDRKCHRHDISYRDARPVPREAAPDGPPKQPGDASGRRP